MAKRNKRLKKQMDGLEKQAERHRGKIVNEEGKKDTTHDYWEGEIERFDMQRKEREKILRGLEKKRKRK